MPEVIGPFVSAACDLWKVGSYPCSETRIQKPVLMTALQKMDPSPKKYIPRLQEAYTSKSRKRIYNSNFSTVKVLRKGAYSQRS